MSEQQSLTVLIVVAVAIVSASLVLWKMRNPRQSFRLSVRISDVVARVCDGMTADLNASISCSRPVPRFLRVVLAEVCSGISFRFYCLVKISSACVVMMTVIVKGAGLMTVTPILWVWILFSGIVAVPRACGVVLRILGDLTLRVVDIGSSLRIASLRPRSRPATCRCGLWRTNVVGCG